MKRFYCLFALIAMIAANVQSSTTSFLAVNDVMVHDTPKTWSCAYFLCSNSTATGFDYITFFVDNDTVIGGVQYKKLWYVNDFLYYDSLSLSIVGQLQENIIQQSKRFVCPIRYADDGKKLYCHIDDNDYLLFDYGVQIGDTCRVLAGINLNTTIIPENEYVHIDLTIDTDNILELVVQNIRIYNGYNMIDLADLSHPGNPAYQTTWVDGVGSIYGLTSIPEGGIDCSTTPALICAWTEDRQKLYEASDETLVFWNPEFFVACPNIGMLTTDADMVDDHSQEAPVNPSMYNILGLRVDKDYHGIVIQDGKKILAQ